MRLTDEHIAQFQKLYAQRFGRALTKEEALVKGTQLATLMEVVLRENARAHRLKLQLEKY